ncbi:ankyrin repeat domain-containing protein 29-like [Halyomorpha halys]|uniref:ankyrin repeat domain-containing protein 29-like n=1 Tax=Halyomorpha halys TaxID=286706 RepID=UPI0006D50715|nr:serine/threonine-protein phosphatase 6 regulatory ankyrin repeat subunit B-like [Halyomorpha halys]
MVASSTGHLDVVKLLISRGGMLNDTDNDGNTVLHYGAREGHIGVVRALLELGANLSAKGEEGKKSLMEASLMGNSDVVNTRADVTVLLEHGADLRAKAERHLNVVKFLIVCGATFNDRDNYGNTVMHLAPQEGNVVTELVRGAHLSAKEEMVEHH